MSDGGESKARAEAAAPASSDLGSRIGRTALTATSLLVALLTVAGLLALLMRRQRTQDLDDHYARMAAHVTEEVERRLESERAVADTLAQAVPVLDATLAAGRTLAAAEANAKHAEAAVALVDHMALAANEDVNAGAGAGTGADEARLIQQRVAKARNALGSAKNAADDALREARTADDKTQAAKRAAVTEKSAPQSQATTGIAGTKAAGQAERDSATARERAIDAAKRAEKTAASADAALQATETDAKKWLTAHGASPDDPSSTPAREPTAKPPPASASPQQKALQKALQEVEATRTAVEAAKRELERSGSMPSYRKFGNDCLATSPTELYLCFTRALLREVLHSPGNSDIVPCAGARARVGSATFVFFPVTTAAAGQLCLRVPLASAAIDADGDDTAGTGDRNFDEMVLVDRQSGAVLYAAGRDSQAKMSVLPGFDAKTMGAARRNADVEIGSSRYRMFLQPVATAVPLVGPVLPASDGATDAKPKDDATLLLAGLVREDRFGTELYQVRPTAFLWAAAMVAIAVFCWPLAKLWLVGPRTRFGRVDAAFLVTSATIATALSALLFPMLLAQASLGQRLDRQLATVADRISLQLTAQIGTATQALDAFIKQTDPYRSIVATSDNRAKWPELRAACTTLANDGKEKTAPDAPDTDARSANTTPSESPPDAPFTDAPRESAPTTSPGAPRTDVPREGAPTAQLSEVTYRNDERHWPFCELVNAPSLVDADNAAASGELAFWVNSEGLQQLKRVTTAQGTPAVAVANRNYFQQALAGKAYALGPPSPGGVTTGNARTESSLGVPEVVRSVTSSQKVLLVARPTVSDSGKVTGVAAVEAKIGALRAPVLPKGFQMAVLRGDGTVMLHSKLDAHHGHFFFEDLGGRAAGDLQALMASATSGEIDARYRGTPSRLRVQRDPGTGWFVVVIASQGLLDVVVTDTALSSLACLGLFALLLGAIAALAALVRGSRAKLSGDALAGHVLSLRPHARLSPAYASAGLRMIIAASTLGIATLIAGCFMPTTLLVGLALLLALWASLSIPGLWGGMQIAARQVSAASSWRDDLPITYALACFGLANIFIILPTTVFFVGGHCAAVGNLLRAEQDHYRENLESRAACLAPPSDEHAPDKCPDVFWTKDVHRAKPVNDPTSVTWFASSMLWPVASLTDRLPLYTSAKYDTALLDRASPDAVPPPPRSWVRSGSTLHLQPLQASWALESDLPRLVAFDSWDWPVLVILLFIGLTAGANAVAYQTIQRLFFTEVLTERKGALAVRTRLTPDALARELLPAKHARILILHPPCELAQKLRSDPRFAPLPELATPCSPPKTVQFIGDLEPVLADRAWSERVRQAATTEPVLLVLSSVDPLRQGTAEQRREWATTLKDFRVVGGPGRPLPVAAAKHAHPLIAGEQPNEAALMHEWTTSDDDEQRVLAQLAIDGYASPNPRNAPTLRHLTARGLLDDDTLTLRDDDFRDFLRRTVTSDDLYAWQAGETALAWHAVRLPLSVGVTILLVLLGVSRPDLAETGALLPPIAAGLPVLLRVLAAMASGKKTAAA